MRARRYVACGRYCAHNVSLFSGAGATVCGTEPRPEVGIAILFELKRELRAAGLHDLPLVHDVHKVWLDIVEKALVVRNQHDGVVLATACVDAARHGFEGVYVQACVTIGETAKACGGWSKGSREG